MGAWAADKGARTPGYLGQTAMLADDGVTSVACIRFADRDSYQALSEDPELETESEGDGFLKRVEVRLKRA